MCRWCDVQGEQAALKQLREAAGAEAAFKRVVTNMGKKARALIGG